MLHWENLPCGSSQVPALYSAPRRSTTESLCTKRTKQTHLNVSVQCNLQRAIQHYLLTKNQTPKASTFHGSFTDRWLNLGGKVDIRDMLWHSYVTETNHTRLQILLCTCYDKWNILSIHRSIQMLTWFIIRKRRPRVLVTTCMNIEFVHLTSLTWLNLCAIFWSIIYRR